MKILIIEDDASLQELMTKTLKQDGYVVENAYDFDSAMDRFGVYAYDCVLLDINLPGGSGLDLLEHMKKTGCRSDVIIISARDSIEDKVAGLDLGADDYLAKPFYVAELSARIKSVLRRGNAAVTKVMTAGNISLDLQSRRVTIDGNYIPLLKKEFDILLYFMQRPGHIVDKAVLAEAVWGDHIDMADNFQFVYAQIKNLRKRLADAGASQNIKAVYGFGYKFADVEE